MSGPPTGGRGICGQASTGARDPWAAWLLERRHGGDERTRRRLLPQLERFREGVLAAAEVRAGDTVLDVGCGDGLIGFGALPLVGADGTVIFSDVSEELLDVCRERADGDERCRFVRAAAEDLTPLADESVDVVATRSVAIYVAEKQRAFDEFVRVLRPAGRLSMFEPINSFAYPEAEGVFAGYDVSPVRDVAAKLRDAERRTYDACAMLGFDERDLVAWAERAGFREVSLRLEIEVKAEPLWVTRDWDVLVNSSPNPLAPTLAEAMAETLTPEEAERFTAHLRPLVERGEGTSRTASAWLRAGQDLNAMPCLATTFPSVSSPVATTTCRSPSR